MLTWSTVDRKAVAPEIQEQIQNTDDTALHMLDADDVAH